MLTLRQEALQIVNEIPDNLLAECVSYLRNFKTKFEKKSGVTEEEFQKFLHSGAGIDPKKAAAFAALEELRKKNTVHLPPGTDWKKEIAEARNEKYGYLD